MAELIGGGSVIDFAFRRILIWAKLFTKSWGNPKILRRTLELRRNVMEKGAAMEMVERSQSKMIISQVTEKNGTRYMEGHFESPYMKACPEMMPGNVGIAHWKGVFPKNKKRSLVVHLAGTGDHSYYRYY
ncbi:hypothetical protein AB6A40_009667 [Gnathostoma spinigerum]|uniref:Uncharacterized protein n=1 Tax=Gnathostoma spinigerum TaxID=75299 RepID=A0ABD6ESM4_9BILA